MGGQQRLLVPAVAPGQRSGLPGAGTLGGAEVLRRAKFLGFQVGGERYFCVHHQLLFARQLHHQVRPHARIVAGTVDLLHEIDVPQHAGGFHHPPKLDFTPLAAGAVRPEGRLQCMG